MNPKIQEVITSLVYIFIGIMAFQATTYMPPVQDFIRTHPYYVLVGAIILAIYANDIITKVFK